MGQELLVRRRESEEVRLKDPAVLGKQHALEATVAAEEVTQFLNGLIVVHSCSRLV